MLIQIIQENTEAAFLSTLEAYDKKARHCGVLLCRFSLASVRVTDHRLLPLLKDTLSDIDGQLYFCSDGDVAVVWRGRFKEIMEAIISVVSNAFPQLLDGHAKEEIFRFYDSKVNGEDLRLLFRERLNKVTAASPQAKIETQLASRKVLAPAKEAQFSNEQLWMLHKTIPLRRFKKMPDILIVDDQAFSLKLLMGLLEDQYPCHTARTGAEAIAAYAEYAPCIALLDVELPDISGHALAALFKKYDPDSFIVMVTGNNYVSDVVAANTNKVQGFVVKPFNKQKIFSRVEAYLERRNT